MRFVAPYRSLMFAPVSGSSVDSGYLQSWLTDGRPGYPVRVTGTLNLTVTPAVATSVDVIALCTHNIRQAATVTLGGSLSGGITTAAMPPDNIPLNIYRRLTSPVSVTTIVLGVSGNTDPIVIGELYAGLSYKFPITFRHGLLVDPGQPFAWEGPFTLMAPYDPGVAVPRRLKGELLLTTAELAELTAWYQSTRNGTRPSLIIPDDAVNDAWLAVFQYTVTTDGANHIVSIEIAELPRVRW